MSVTKISQNGKTREINVNLKPIVELPTDGPADRFLKAGQAESARIQAEAAPVPAPIDRFSRKGAADSARRSEHVRTVTREINQWEILIDMLAYLGKHRAYNLAAADNARAARRLSTYDYPEDLGGRKINNQSLYFRLSSYIRRVVESGKPEPEFITLSFDCNPEDPYFLNNLATYTVVANAEKLFDRYSNRPEEAGSTNQRSVAADKAQAGDYTTSDLVSDGQFEQRAGELDDPKLNELRDTQEGPSTVL